MYKKIIIATDGAEQSGSAVVEAINIAAKSDSQIYLLHILKIMVGVDGVGGCSNLTLMQKLEESAKKYMEMFKGLAAADGALKCETVIRHGVDFYTAIIDEINKKGADLIMMGRKNPAHPLKRFLFGSVTGKILKKSPCDILIVPLASLVQWDKLLFPVIDDKNDDALADKILCLAKQNNSKIFLNGIYSQEQFKSAAENKLNKLSEQFKKNGLSVESGLVQGEPSELINRCALENNADIIVMNRTMEKSFKTLFYGSFTERVIENSICSILILV
ncbi:MAG TPA: universal stress protein [bacterium]|nr:universal stress protein [bacterium]HPN30255.1 universal stress protein [bacterium]